MSRTDFIPHSYDALLSWLQRLTMYVASNSERFQIDNEQRLLLENKVVQYQEACNRADAENAGKVDKADRKEAADEIRRFIRIFINENLRYNRNVTDHDRREMGLPVHDGTPSTIPVPATIPTLNVTVISPRRLAIHFYEGDGSSKAKPYGTNGAVIGWSVADAQPATQDDLAHTALATRTPHTIEFSETERGKTVYFAICWQNEKGQRGAWSEFQSTVIP